MKTVLALLVTMVAFNSFADEACKSLSSYEGTYTLVRKTCDGPFGGDLSVETDQSADTPFVITSGGVGIGPAVTSNSTDRCINENGSFIVQTCVGDKSCLPRGWQYKFSGHQVIFTANGCEAAFVKE